MPLLSSGLGFAACAFVQESLTRCKTVLTCDEFCQLYVLQIWDIKDTAVLMLRSERNYGAWEKFAQYMKEDYL